MDVKTLCLGILTLGNATGYEIKKQFEEAFSHFYAAGYGSIYPALNQLAADGLVTFTEVEQEKRPDKKVYSITDAGRRRFAEVLAQTPPRHRLRSEFMVLMFFAQMLPTERIAEVIEEELARNRDVLTRIECAEGSPEWNTPGGRVTLEFGRALTQAAIDYLERKAPVLLEELAAPSEDTTSLDAEQEPEIDETLTKNTA